MSTAFMPVLRRGATTIRASTMDGANAPAMKMATGCVKCMCIPWKGFGRCCAVGCVPIGASPKRNSRSTWGFSSSCTTCASEAKRCWERSLSYSSQKTLESNKSVTRYRDTTSEAEAIKRLSRSPHWVWVAIDPVSKLLLAIDVGPRTLAMAQSFVHQVVRLLAPDCVPLFLTDGFKEYSTALLTHFGQWVQPERRQAPGPMPKPRWIA